MLESQTLLFGLFTLLLGAIIGNWLAIGRDKRKEFNAVAYPFREALYQQLSGIPEKKYRPDLVTNDMFVSFSVFVPNTSRYKYFKDVSTYQECFVQHTYPDPEGRYYKVVCNGDFAALEEATKRLLQYCELK